MDCYTPSMALPVMNGPDIQSRSWITTTLVGRLTTGLRCMITLTAWSMYRRQAHVIIRLTAARLCRLQTIQPSRQSFSIAGLLTAPLGRMAAVYGVQGVYLPNRTLARPIPRP